MRNLIYIAAIVFFLVPAKTFAISDGLISNKNVYIGTDINNIKLVSPYATDGDENTYVTIQKSSTGEKLIVEFEKPVRINGYKLLATEPESSYRLHFYNENYANIKSYVTSDYRGNKINIDELTNVKYVEIRNATAFNKNIYEFNLYGIAPEPDPLVHDYDLKDFYNRPSDEKINSFINKYRYILPILAVDKNGNSYFQLLGSNDLITISDEDGIFHVYAENLFRLTASGHEFSYAEEWLIALEGNLKKLTTDVGNPNTLKIFYTYEEKKEERIEITNLLASIVSKNNILLTWDSPDSEKFTYARIYLNGQLISETIQSSFEIKNLNYDTLYTIKVTAVDIDNNESSGIIKSIRTELEPTVELEPPKNVYVKSGNKSLYIYWDRVKHSDLVGYYVYINGQKVNDEPITKTSMIVNDLVNGQEYDIKVSSVTTSEEKFSDDLRGVPTEKVVPIVNMKYGLVDLLESIKSMFSSIWGILAFSVSISVSIYIAHRVKLLFLG